jgi:hypothetical protein
MSRGIERFLNLLHKLDPFKGIQKTRVCITENGFRIIYPWSLLQPKEKTVPWDNVEAIYVRLTDDFVCHFLSLEFVDFSGASVIAVEDMEGWQSLCNEVQKRFPSFNTHNFESVNRFFPGQGHLACWKHGERVEDAKAEIFDNGQAE